MCSRIKKLRGWTEPWTRSLSNFYNPMWDCVKTLGWWTEPQRQSLSNFDRPRRGRVNKSGGWTKWVQLGCQVSQTPLQRDEYMLQGLGPMLLSVELGSVQGHNKKATAREQVRLAQQHTLTRHPHPMPMMGVTMLVNRERNKMGRGTRRSDGQVHHEAESACAQKRCPW